LGVTGRGTAARSLRCHLQGYVAHKKQPPPRTLQQDYAWGPIVLLREGSFLMSEVPL